MKKIKKEIAKFFARTYFQPFFETLHSIALKGMNYGSANNPKDSGEINLLKKLAKELPFQPVIFDVGSNNGQYLHLLLQNLKNLEPTIHCFEPEKSAFDDLQNHFGDFPNVLLNNFALGDKKAKLTLFSEAFGDVKSSFVNIGDDNLMRNQNEIEIATLDDYCEERNITKIHFLKIDVEGFETNVVIGSERMIKNNGIERIQLEHGSTHSIVMGASLFNFKKLLVDYGLFHIKQNGIRKIKYTPQMEIFFNSNYYFKKKNLD